MKVRIAMGVCLIMNPKSDALLSCEGCFYRPRNPGLTLHGLCGSTYNITYSSTGDIKYSELRALRAYLNDPMNIITETLFSDSSCSGNNAILGIIDDILKMSKTPPANDIMFIKELLE
jgi:hypothetical protein